jgi:hypothetical protein
MKTATPQNTFDHMMGAGALSWSWWASAPAKGAGTPGWKVALTGGYPGEEKTATVTYAVVLKAARAVTGNTPEGASAALVRECRHLIFDAEETDFDAASSDELLQLIVFGKIIYG